MIGEIKTHALETLPENWLWCDGATYQRDDYPKLYEVLASTLILDADSFKTPDLAIRFPYGAPEGADWIGLQGGEASHQLSISELPQHNHPWQVANTNVVLNTGATVTGLRITGVAASGFYLQPLGGQATALVGGNIPHNNLPPYTFVRYAIVAK